MSFVNIFGNINTREVLKNLPDAVIVTDLDGKIVWANDKSAIIFETRAKDLKGLYFDEIVANGLALAENAYSKRNSVVTGAFTPEGKEFFIEMSAKKYVEQYFITIRDVTAMTNILAVAERTGRLNKEKNVMFVKLSNEIKSPLQSIIGFSQALLDGLGGEVNDKQSKYVKIINKNSTELLYFMDKFLEFSQAESSLFSADIQPFDLLNAIQSVVKFNESDLSAKNIEVNYEVDEDFKKTVYSDENALKIIVQNILETSIKLTDAGTIAIKLSQPDEELIKTKNLITNKEYVHIVIADTGIGLSKSEIDEIFEPYTQLDKINKKTFLRSITLGTVQTIVRRLGGTIWIESDVMKGSAFNVILPKKE